MKIVLEAPSKGHQGTGSPYHVTKSRMCVSEAAETGTVGGPGTIIPQSHRMDPPAHLANPANGRTYLKQIKINQQVRINFE